MQQTEQANSLKRVRDVMEQDFDFLVALRESAEPEAPSDTVSVAQPRHDPQIIRRLYIRTLVSLIESAVSTFKQDAVDSGNGLSDGEKLLLRERVFDLNDKGEVFNKQFIAPLPKSLKFAYRCFGKCHGLSRLPDFSGDGWRHFLELVKIRNRLTHPKSAVGLEVTDAEMDIADRAELWFHLSNTALLEEYNENLLAENAELNAQIALRRGASSITADLPANKFIDTDIRPAPLA